ncbi:MAG: Rieske (2Fe-2S) protein [Chitinophagaceae bacterium]
MSSNKMKWFKLESVGPMLPSEGNIEVMEINHKKISITRFKGDIYAFAFKCPHAGGILAEGYLDAQGNVVCPLHRYKYNIQNGFNVSGEGYFLMNYPTEQREDGIYVGFEDNSIWNIFK